MEELRNILPQYALLAGLDEKQIELIYPMINIKYIEPLQLIFQEDEPGDTIVLLLEGTVEVVRNLTLPLSNSDSAQSDTREKALIRFTHHQHPFLGEMSFLDEETTRSATVKTITACKLGFIDNRELLRLCQKDLSIGFVIMTNIIRKLSKDLRLANQNVLKLTTALNLILDK